MQSLLAIALFLPFFLTATEVPKIGHLSSHRDGFYFLINEKECFRSKNFAESARLVECVKNFDLPLLQTIETNLAPHNLRIFQAVIGGLSLLQRSIYHFGSCEEPSEKSRAFIDYLFSKVSEEELNAFIVTSVDPLERKTYYGTAAAVAALTSPYCFHKITTHPFFNPINFETPRLVDTQYDVISLKQKFLRIQSVTPLICLEILKKNGHKNTRIRALIGLLEAYKTVRAKL